MAKTQGVVKTARFANVSRSTIWRWRSHGIGIKKRKPRSTPVFDGIREQLEIILGQSPCKAVHQMKHQLHKPVSLRSIYKYIRRLGYTRKRTRWRGMTADKARELALKLSFLRQYTQCLNRDQLLVSVDECGFSERVQPLYGFAPKGCPLVIKHVGGGWKHYSLLLAVSSDGTYRYQIHQGAITRIKFQQFVSGILYANGATTMLLDNASIHKNIVFPAGLCPVYTPPYTPEYNAIELCFSQIKHTFRNQRQEFPDVVECITHSFQATLSPTCIQSCFDHVRRLVLADENKHT